MQRISKKADHIARLKRPPKEDWRAKQHKHQKKTNPPEPFVANPVAFLQEPARLHPGAFSALLIVGMFSQMAMNTAKAPTNHSINTHPCDMFESIRGGKTNSCIK